MQDRPAPPKYGPLLNFIVLIVFTLSPNLFGTWSAQGMQYTSSVMSPEMRTLKSVYVAVLLVVYVLIAFLLVRILRSRALAALAVFALGLLTLTELAYRSIFNLVTDSNFWTVALQSSFYEKQSYLAGYGTQIFASLILLAGFAWLFASLNARFRVAGPEAPGVGLRVSVYLLAAAILFAGLTSTLYGSASPERMEPTPDGIYEAAQYLFPFNVAYAFFQMHLQDVYARTIRAARRQAPHQIESRFAGPALIVLVIGESATSTHWSLTTSATGYPPSSSAITGYERTTTPELAQVKDLVYFPRAFSLAHYTRASVPMIVRLFTSETLTYFYKDPTLVSAFNDLGYHTHWYSMQGAGGVHDDSVRMLSAEANDEHFLSIASFRENKLYDDQLLQDLPDLNQIEGKNFFVLHTIGSHTAYHHRYPPEFAKFQPTFAADEWGEMFTKNKEDLAKTVNGYDNSILYTDHFLNELIQRVRNSHRSALVAYISDHGQGLGEPGCGVLAHAFRCNSAFQVPLIFWATPEYRAAHADQWDQLRRNTAHPVSALSFGMTFLDLAGATYAGRLERYVLSEQDGSELPVRALAGGDPTIELPFPTGSGHGSSPAPKPSALSR